MPTGVSLFVWLPEERAKWGRDAGQAGPRDPRHVRAMSADLGKAQAEGWLAVVGVRVGVRSHFLPTTGDPRFSETAPDLRRTLSG